MQSFWTSRALLTPLLLGAALLAGAAGTRVGVTDGVAPLSPQGSPAFSPLIKRVIATNATFQAAPIPNQDASAPNDLGAAPEAQVGPKFISPRSLFQGDGYAQGSSAEGSLDDRKTAAAGLGLSVPLSGK